MVNRRKNRPDEQESSLPHLILSVENIEPYMIPHLHDYVDRGFGFEAKDGVLGNEVITLLKCEKRPDRKEFDVEVRVEASVVIGECDNEQLVEYSKFSHLLESLGVMPNAICDIDMSKEHRVTLKIVGVENHQASKLESELLKTSFLDKETPRTTRITIKKVWDSRYNTYTITLEMHIIERDRQLKPPIFKTILGYTGLFPAVAGRSLEKSRSIVNVPSM